MSLELLLKKNRLSIIFKSKSVTNLGKLVSIIIVATFAYNVVIVIEL